MHLFIFDSFLSQKKFQKTVLKLETAIPSLNLEAKSVKLSFLKDVREVVPDGLKRGYTTLICVGNDQTFSKVLNSLPTFEGVTTGIIPIRNGEDDNLIASALGIDDIDSAFGYVQKRIVAKVDIGRANNHYFMSQLVLSESDVEILCEEKFTFKSLKMGCSTFLHNLTNGSPQDGFLEIGIKSGERPSALDWLGSLFGQKQEPDTQTRIPVKKVMVTVAKKDSFTSIADQKIILKNPATIEVLPGSLRVIVGKSIFA